MKRLNIVVEGQAEETFINEVLAHHLAQFDVGAIARRVEFSHKKKTIFRGGLIEYAKLRRDVVNWLNQDRAAFVTTMVDLYALPDDFPKRSDARIISDAQKKADFLEQAFADDIGAKMFIPNIQLHEFETLLFVDIRGLRSYYPTHAKEIDSLHAETERFKNPEEINEGRATAPSKRIIKYVPSYGKVIAGSLMAIDLGLAKIRPSCQHFDGWLTKLERLP